MDSIDFSMKLLEEAEVAVSPGGGFGPLGEGYLRLALVENELDVARAAGFKRAQVSFFIGNTPAERAYAKAGFTFAEERRSADFEAAMGTPGTIRFARDL